MRWCTDLVFFHHEAVAAARYRPWRSIEDRALTIPAKMKSIPAQMRSSQGGEDERERSGGGRDAQPNVEMICSKKMSSTDLVEVEMLSPTWRLSARQDD
ncbi:hypothetical protein Dimus_033664 [Dionaea muscipula]